MSVKIIVKNKKASFNYEIIEKYESGVVLTGSEVKAIKNSQINISDSFIKIEDSEAWLWNTDIPLYRFSTDPAYNPTRSRKLLLRKQELHDIETKLKSKGFALFPIAVYLSRGKVKVEIGLGRGRKSHEKQRRIKERDLDRQLHIEKRKYMVE